ncbi:MAG: hypothetical protein SF066_22335 [Thermoanaerobaculia bacterium]|nr:hypothetical protein [Thermoanaerobaculia bacterium]
MNGEAALGRAYAQGFLVHDPPPATRRPLHFALPGRPLARLSEVRLVLGAHIGASGRRSGRLGPVLVRDGHQLAFSAGHVFTAAGEAVFSGDQAVGRVLALARPRTGVATVDAALIQLAAEVVGPRGAGLRRLPGWRPPECGELVRLAGPGLTGTGRVLALGVTARMRDGDNEFLLGDQLAIAGFGFSVGGDSGAALLGADGAYLGLLVGRQAGVAVATPMASLFAVFGGSVGELGNRHG